MPSATPPPCQCSMFRWKNAFPNAHQWAGTLRFVLEVCPRNRRQIRPDGTQMSDKSWFGGVLGPCGGVLEPSGPENPTGCILGCENHVRGSPLGDAFWYNSGVFLCFFLLSFRPCAQNGILWIFMRFWAYFRLHFLSFLEQGGSSFFCNPSEQNHDFQDSRTSIF